MSEPTPPPTDQTDDDGPEDTALTDRIHANGKALAWDLYERSASRHIRLQRHDPQARRLALLLNPPDFFAEHLAQLVIAGGIFAERALCVKAVAELQQALPAGATEARAALDLAIGAIKNRGPVKIAPEWETDAITELFVAADEPPTTPEPEGD